MLYADSEMRITALASDGARRYTQLANCVSRDWMTTALPLMLQTTYAELLDRKRSAASAEAFPMVYSPQNHPRTVMKCVFRRSPSERVSPALWSAICSNSSMAASRWTAMDVLRRFTETVAALKRCCGNDT